jgi:hypothetical protein
MPTPSLYQLRKGIHRLHDEAAGVLEVKIVRFCDLPALAQAAAGGDCFARRTLDVLAKFLDGVGRAPRRSPSLCATCPRVLRRSKFACVAAWPSRDDPSNAICFGVCVTCAADGSDANIGIKAAAFLRRIWPESRLLDANQIHAGGRA